jgi:hypothetical protein
MLVDYSKEIIPKETMRLFFVLAVESMFCRRQNQQNRKRTVPRVAEERMIAKMACGVVGPAAGVT